MNVSEAMKCRECKKYIITYSQIVGGYYCSTRCYQAHYRRTKAKKKKEEEKWRQAVLQNISKK